ncbi:AT-rich interactive domain-containing protein 2 isoform X2 [Punica granatum]|uniref:AT-rich interactive domain-containing protein 2 isoform X2 n=1 Tax=Punica granatum TaxID=22663 RepID=A0A6P8BZ01_PUNGR|nr:AT-rich interactive domain-containing protein 2 isoform X2 [Punica granatum]
MAKWSVLKHGSVLDSSDNGGFSDPENRPLIKDRVDDSRIEYIDKLRSLFYKVLVAFLKDVADRACVHPVLAKTGDGQLVDLFELYCTVRRRGGYGAVSESGEWGLVTRELGFDGSYISLLKLMHFKYLSEFDTWLRDRCRDVLVENENLERGLNDFGSLSLELEMGFKVLVFDGVEEANIQYRALYADNESKASHWVATGHNITESLATVGMGSPDMVSRKRKQESLERMLAWVVDVAKHSDDPRVSLVPEQSKLRMQALLARDSLFQRRIRQTNLRIQNTPLQKKLKLQPSNCSDRKESSRCSQSLPILAKSCLSLPCYSLPIFQARSIGPKKQLENCLKTQAAHRLTEPKDDCTNTYWTSIFCCDEPDPTPKPTGPLFQAKVPEWTGIIFESDPKWLGTELWPPQRDAESLGRGRVNSCSCLLPGSVECIRFHIAEERMSLKLQLGYSLFYDWRFNCMGEEVSLRWTSEEETRFKDIVRLNSPSQGVTRIA